MTIQSTNQLAVLTATFTYGSQRILICDAAEDFVVGANTFLSDVKLSFEAPERVGLLDEDDATLTLSLDLDFPFELADGRATAPTQVSVVEFVMLNQVGSPQADLIYHFTGSVGSIQINPDGEAGIARLELISPKGKLEKGLDNLALEKCRNDFASGKVCQYDREGQVETFTVTAISGNEVTVSSVGSPPSIRWYQDGYIERNGQRIKIRNWSSTINPLTFTLAQVPPLDWEESVPFDAEFAPGCDKTISDCRLFNQEEFFRGIGVTIPEHHPVFSKPRFVP